jgi:hypothetical protein
MLCKLEDCGLPAVTELKRLTEVQTGLDPELTVPFHAEYGELKGGVRISGVVGLHPATNRSASYRAAPHEVTSGHFNTAYAALVPDPVDILDLSGCCQICDFSGLLQLPMLVSPNPEGNRLNTEGAQQVADAIKAAVIFWCWSFWYHFHLTSGSTTAGYDPQDLGSLDCERRRWRCHAHRRCCEGQ